MIGCVETTLCLTWHHPPVPRVESPKSTSAQQGKGIADHHWPWTVSYKSVTGRFYSLGAHSKSGVFFTHRSLSLSLSLFLSLSDILIYTGVASIFTSLIDVVFPQPIQFCQSD